MDYKNNSNTGLIIVADCMLLSVEYIGNVHLFFNSFFVLKCCFFLKSCERVESRLESRSMHAPA